MDVATTTKNTHRSDVARIFKVCPATRRRRVDSFSVDDQEVAQCPRDGVRLLRDRARDKRVRLPKEKKAHIPRPSQNDGELVSAERRCEERFALGANRTAEVVSRRLGKRGARRSTRENPAGLTRRELEVLPLIAQGLSNRQVADRLVVSTRTVEHHVAAILRKLGARSRAEASATAVRLGLAD